MGKSHVASEELDSSYVVDSSHGFDSSHALKLNHAMLLWLLTMINQLIE
jgi:hypothetical protein